MRSVAPTLKLGSHVSGILGGKMKNRDWHTPPFSGNSQGASRRLFALEAAKVSGRRSGVPTYTSLRTRLIDGSHSAEIIILSIRAARMGKLTLLTGNWGLLYIA